jgi:hypothetical protein
MVFDIVRPMLAAKMRKTAESAGGAARRPGEGAPGDPKPVGGGENPRPPSGMGASFGGGSGKGFQGYGLKENGSQGG